MLAELSVVTSRWCVIYLCTALIVTCLDSSPQLFPFLSCSVEYYCYTQQIAEQTLIL